MRHSNAIRVLDVCDEQAPMVATACDRFLTREQAAQALEEDVETIVLLVVIVRRRPRAREVRRLRNFAPQIAER